MYKTIYLSVHDIVDTLLRRGHLDTRIFNQSSMQEGSRLHSLYQKEQSKNYIAEYSLEYTFHSNKYIFVVSGKADGVIIDELNNVTVEEIKTTVDDLDNFIKDHGEWHLGQAMFYAYILSEDKNLKYVNVIMTYIKQTNFKIRKQITKIFSKEELSNFVNGLILKYALYCDKIERFKKERNESIAYLTFPFNEYRKGQKEMMDFISEKADLKENCYIQAPTGIGKTISVLFPMISRFKDKNAERIFYITSKNSIKKIAMNTLSIFKDQGVKVKSIEFTSKENICFNDKVGHCNPDECPFARNYYDKLYDAIFDSLEENDTFTRSVVESIAYKLTMCPFQLQLDLSNYCDVLVIDYSYVYDYHDRLCLKESNIKSTNTYLLIDECHNLPDRVRDMYSIDLYVESFKKAISHCIGKEFKSLKVDLKSAQSILTDIYFDKDNEDYKREGVYVLEELSQSLIDDIKDCLTDFKSIMKKTPYLISDELLDFFYTLNSFYILADEYVDNENYKKAFLIYLNIKDEEIVSLRIACLDSKMIIKENSSFFSSCVYFTATLSPIDYYIDLLGGEKDENTLILSSPFKKENRLVIFDYNHSLKYKDRDLTLFPVYNLIKTVIEAKKGNYFVFCPSFEYLDKLQSFFNQENIDINLLVQNRYMKEEERQEFLNCFSIENKKTTVGLLVIGGIFSEGIDLVGDRLIGAIIISVGLPQIGFEKNHMKGYFDSINNEKNGFNYAYTYPGINKILQAGGRVIRTDNDKGIIFYIDTRFKQNPYNKIMKENYPDSKGIISPSQLKAQLKLFWKDDKK